MIEELIDKNKLNSFTIRIKDSTKLTFGEANFRGQIKLIIQ